MYFLSDKRDTDRGWRLLSWSIVWCWCSAGAMILFPYVVIKYSKNVINITHNFALSTGLEPYICRAVWVGLSSEIFYYFSRLKYQVYCYRSIVSRSDVFSQKICCQLDRLYWEYNQLCCWVDWILNNLYRNVFCSHFFDNFWHQWFSMFCQ